MPLLERVWYLPAMPTRDPRWLRTVATVMAVILAVLFCGAFVRDDLLRGDYQTVMRWGRIYNRVLVAWALATVGVCVAVAVLEKSVGFGIIAAAGLLVAFLLWFVNSLPSGMLG